MALAGSGGYRGRKKQKRHRNAQQLSLLKPIFCKIILKLVFCLILAVIVIYIYSFFFSFFSQKRTKLNIKCFTGREKLGEK